MQSTRYRAIYTETPRPMGTETRVMPCNMSGCEIILSGAVVAPVFVLMS